MIRQPVLAIKLMRVFYCPITADLTNNFQGGIQILLKRDRLLSRTCLVIYSGDIRSIKVKVTIAPSKETEQELKNEPFRIVSPKRSRKYIERQRKKRVEQTSSKKNYRKSNLKGGQ